MSKKGCDKGGGKKGCCRDKDGPKPDKGCDKSKGGGKDGCCKDGKSGKGGDCDKDKD
ncbi:hypothetical protein ACFLZO_00470 [Patescibacteria group bacterium]